MVIVLLLHIAKWVGFVKCKLQLKFKLPQGKWLQGLGPSDKGVIIEARCGNLL